MSNISPFQATTLCYAISATNSASTAVQITSIGTATVNQYWLYNAGTVMVFVAFASTAAAAQTAAVAPVAGTPQNVIGVPPGSIQTFSELPSAWVSAIGVAAGPTTIYIMGGEGA